jgi:putative ABC transport system ATP-binding protein
VSLKELLLAKDVTASRPGETGLPVRVLQKTTLGVNAGELLAVVGPSGSGKSTLLRLYNRLLEPESGQILLSGRDIKSFPPPVLRARIPLVAQKPFLFHGTVKDNLQASARLRRAALPDFQSEEIKCLIERCQVSPTWFDRDARKLSIGQQQRICLARAMLGPCEALLLDEPTSALDRPTADQMAKSFRQLAGDMRLAIILVTHDLRLAEFCADRVALLLDGAVVEEGPPSHILNNPKTAGAKRFLTSEPLEHRGAKA